VGALLAASLLLPSSAPGSTVSEQRSRLPPKAECEDPVVGVWKSHNYNDVYRQWTEFTLEVRRVPGDEASLEGRILNHSWHGSEKQVQPPESCRGELRYEVTMDARGTARGLQVEFWGVAPWRLDRTICGSSLGFGYNLDHFSGAIDPEIQEFQSVNNDGGISVNEPTVFRRIRCFEGPAPTSDVEPPPFQPPAVRGCGGW
jgi:hypothetical protein